MTKQGNQGDSHLLNLCPLTWHRTTDQAVAPTLAIYKLSLFKTGTEYLVRALCCNLCSNQEIILIRNALRSCSIPLVMITPLNWTTSRMMVTQCDKNINNQMIKWEVKNTNAWAGLSTVLYFKVKLKVNTARTLVIILQFLGKECRKSVRKLRWMCTKNSLDQI